MSATARHGGRRINVRARPLAWFALVAVAVVFLAVGSIHPPASTASERISRLDSIIKCPSCADLSIAQSDDPVATALRREVATDVREGLSDQAIENRIVARYGSTVLLSPSARGIDAAIWIVPIVALVVAVVAVGFVLVRRRGGDGDGASEADETLVRAALAEREALT